MRRPLTIVVAVVIAVLVVAAGWLTGQLWAPRLPPFVCYDAHWPEVNPNVVVTLKDQYMPEQGIKVTVGLGKLLCAPVEEKKLPKDKQPAPVQNGDHLYCYDLDPISPPDHRTWLIGDQFGRKSVIVEFGVLLCEPADKTLLPPDDPTLRGR